MFLVWGEESLSLLERKEGWQHLRGYWAVSCVVSMSLFSLGITVMFSWRFLPTLDTGRYRQLFSCGSCQFSPFPCAGRKGIRRMAGMTKLRVIFWQREITCSYRQSLWPLSFASKCMLMPADKQRGLDRMSFLLVMMILDNS